MESTSGAITRLSAVIDRIRPAKAVNVDDAERHLRIEIARLAAHPDQAAALRNDAESLLALRHQAAFYAETGIRSALGSWLELTQRIGRRLLPEAPDDTGLHDSLRRIFHQPDDHIWVAAVSDESWRSLAEALALDGSGPGGAPPPNLTAAALDNVLEAARMLSYRLAGTALDREFLRAEPALERYESPFLAQNAALVPLLERARGGGQVPQAGEVHAIEALLDQCDTTLDRVRHQASKSGISIRLTYLLARLRQLVMRLRALLGLTVADDPLGHAVLLFKRLLSADQTRHQVGKFIGTSLSLLARNVTDHASSHGEHYIAADRAAWWAMARAAALGGVIIALMAMVKVRLSLLHLPPLTEGIAYGLNYSIGFILIHLLGGVVATKQPAMTAATIAATVEEAKPRELERLGNLVQNVLRTQFIAVLGNVGLALPVACLIALAWPWLFGAPLAPAAKIENMLHEIDPLHSAALWFAAVAGAGLFLSGLVSGYFDNQARYHQLAQRIAAVPQFAWLGQDRAARLGTYIDTHYGALLGNLFFGMYLGLMGTVGGLTGLPVDIRHVAFSSANVGTAITLLEPATLLPLLPWALAGVVSIAVVNLVVSFALALYVAMKSRQLGGAQIIRLAGLLLRRFVRQPLEFFRPPAR